MALCTATSDQEYPTIVSDGAGGAIVAWKDWRSDYGDIYAQRISSDGTVQWTANGVALGTITNEQQSTTIVADGAGGAIVTWQDYRNGNYDIYAQRISAGGAVQWTIDGVALCTATSDQEYPTIVSDGTGGAIVTWWDARNGADNSDIYAQRISASGTPQWTANGVPLCTAANEQYPPTIVADGAGGAIVTWQDERSGTKWDIYAQRVLAAGFLGMPEQPHITSISDVPNDQGGHVRVTWKASSLDCDSLWGISFYRVYQRSADHWDVIAAVGAEAAASYSLLVHTDADSTPGQALPWIVLRIEALAPDDAVYNSAPDSAYSVDNLAPSAPTLFTGEYARDTATLHWGVNPAADLAEYRLYRGSSADFEPGPGNLVVAQHDTGYADVAGAPYYYKLCAVGVHENASGFTMLLPSGTAGVLDGASLTFALEGVRPNPSHGELLNVVFVLPTAAPARLELLDVGGRRVSEREVGALGAGRHTLDLGAGQNLAPGLYLVRLMQGANVRVTRVAALQ